MSEKIVYYHHNKDHFNIGDFLCTPKHYFNFTAGGKLNQKSGGVLILGGGTYNSSFGAEYVKNFHLPINIGWGLGVTIDRDNPEDLKRSKDSIAAAADLFDACSTRDIENAQLNGKLHFVPCVSVMSDIVELMPGNKTGIFLNADKYRTSIETIRHYSNGQNPGILFSTNAIDELEFRYLFSKTNQIITNSYHVAYWGLLSGRQVAVAGYSSKFSSLIKLFNLDESKLLRYDKNNLQGLDHHIEEVLNNPHYYQQVPNHRDYISEFRSINIKYAETLRDRNLVSGFELIEQNEASLYSRTIEIHGNYDLVKKEVNRTAKKESSSKHKMSRRIYQILKRKIF